MAEPTLYQTLVDAGISIDSHESDLYFPSTPESDAILKGFPLEEKGAKKFIHSVDGGQWWDVPFAYLPWWEEKIRARSHPPAPPVPEGEEGKS